MAQLGTTFNAQDHDTDAQGSYENLPTGIYEMEIEASEVKENSKGNGTLLKITAVVIRPEEYAGRKFFDNFNIQHANPTAQEIGQRQFAQLCRAIGESAVDDSEQLHFKAYTVKMGMGKDSKEKNADGTPVYPASNEVKRYYYPDEGNVPEPGIEAGATPTRAPRQAANSNAPASRPAAAPATGGTKRPWGK